MAGQRATKIETDKRVFTIQGWLLSGVPDYLILKNIEQQYGVCRRQSKNLLQKAYNIWFKDQVASKEEKLALRIDELKQDIRNMKEEFKGTPRGMQVIHQIKKEINKLEGLYPARINIHKGDPESPIVLTDGFTEDKQKRLEQLLLKAQQSLSK